MDTKTIAFLVVGIVVGAAVGIGAGFMLWNDDSEAEYDYWFYFDFGIKADDDNVNQWVKVTATDVVKGLEKAANSAFDDNEFGDGGWIQAINGVAGDSAEYTSWANWFFNMESGHNAWGVWYQTAGMNVTVGNTFYIGLTEYDPVSYDYDMNPNTTSGWSESGPFAA